MRDTSFILSMLFVFVACSEDSRIVLSKHSNGTEHEVLVLSQPITQDSVGTKTIYREDGSVQCIGSYMKGQRHGYWTCYSPDGSIKWSATYNTGEEHGETRCFYDHGTWTRSVVNNDVREGPTTEFNYDSIGNRYFYVYGQYLNNKETGLWTYTDTFGNKLREVWYQNGNPMDTAYYDE